MVSEYAEGISEEDVYKRQEENAIIESALLAPTAGNQMLYSIDVYKRQGNYCCFNKSFKTIG